MSLKWRCRCGSLVGDRKRPELMGGGSAILPIGAKYPNDGVSDGLLRNVWPRTIQPNPKV